MGVAKTGTRAQPLINDQWDILDITSVSGSETALPGEKVTYTARWHRENPNGTGSENFIRWAVRVDRKEIILSETGETIELEMEQEWKDKEILVMAKGYFGDRYSVGQVTEVGEVKKPQITSLSWINADMETVDKAKYGKETFLLISTENCFSKEYFALVVVHCDDWKQDYVDSIAITRPVRLPPVFPFENDPEKKLFSFTPEVEWLKAPKNMHSSEMTATVYIVNSAALNKENANNIIINYNPYSSYAVKAEIETEKISLSKFVIVIDPGHGGKDSGVPKYKNNRHEKDIVLIAANHTKQYLQNEKHINAIMTRSDDTFLSLQERVTITSDNNGDLFVSLHVDSGGSESVDAEGNKVIKYNEQADTVQVYKRKTTNDLTNKLANNLATYLSQIVISTRAIRIGEGNHHVTREQKSHVGAVLIEMGFITNKAQEDQMNNDEYLDKVGKAISNAIITTISDI